MSYTIEFTPRAENPYPSGIKKLKGNSDYFRLRVEDYRVIYAVENDRLIVLVVNVGHRREVYRGL